MVQVPNLNHAGTKPNQTKPNQTKPNKATKEKMEETKMMSELKSIRVVELGTVKDLKADITKKRYVWDLSDGKTWGLELEYEGRHWGDKDTYTYYALHITRFYGKYRALKLAKYLAKRFHAEVVVG